MRDFNEIFDIAANRHGGAEALEAQLSHPLPKEEIAAIPEDRWLAGMTKAIFNAGFHWKVIEAKRAGARTVEINLEASDVASMFDDHLTGPATEMVPAWVNSLLDQ